MNMSLVILLVIVHSVFFIGETEGTFFRFPKGETGETGVLVKLKSGLQMAGKLLGLDAAANSAAQLVADAFSRRDNKEKEEQESGPGAQGLMGALLRLLSLDGAKVGAMVLNGFVFLAQLITTTLVPARPALNESARKASAESPIEWILSNPSESLQKIMTSASDKNLHENLIESVKHFSKEADTSCIQLLICKTAPFIWKMQMALASLNNSNKGNGPEGEKQDGGVHERGRGDSALFRYLPEVREFLEHGEACERQYYECRLMD